MVLVNHRPNIQQSYQYLNLGHLYRATRCNMTEFLMHQLGQGFIALTMHSQSRVSSLVRICMRKTSHINLNCYVRIQWQGSKETSCFCNLSYRNKVILLLITRMKSKNWYISLNTDIITCVCINIWNNVCPCDAPSWLFCLFTTSYYRVC